jgi:hypothetical protein
MFVTTDYKEVTPSLAEILSQNAPTIVTLVAALLVGGLAFWHLYKKGGERPRH